MYDYDYDGDGGDIKETDDDLIDDDSDFEKFLLVKTFEQVFMRFNMS